MEPSDGSFIPREAENPLYGKTTPRVSLPEDGDSDEDLKSAKAQGGAVGICKVDVSSKKKGASKETLLPRKKVKNSDRAQGNEISTGRSAPRYETVPRKFRRSESREASYEEIKPVKNNKDPVSVVNAVYDPKDAAPVVQFSNPVYDVEPNSNRFASDEAHSANSTGPSPDDPVYEVVRTPQQFRRSMNLEPLETDTDNMYEELQFSDSKA